MACEFLFINCDQNIRHKQMKGAILAHISEGLVYHGWKGMMGQQVHIRAGQEQRNKNASTSGFIR